MIAYQDTSETDTQFGNAVYGAELMFRFNVTDPAVTKFNLFASVKWMSESIVNTADEFIYKFAIGN